MWVFIWEVVRDEVLVMRVFLSVKVFLMIIGWDVFIDD